jgi:3'-phosphoadenosine 5'-phosphosulfate sulfotransferase (PAPS reductase)/FAD synthetase
VTYPIAIVCLSGGKDSTATALVAIERYGRERVRLVFADTGHEHPMTLEYVQDYLPKALGVPVETVRADFSARIAGKRAYIEANWEEAGVPAERVRRALELLHPTRNPFLDLCLWKGRFPIPKTKLCTQELKQEPIDALMIEARAAGHRVESWRGVRRAANEQRVDTPDEDVGGGTDRISGKAYAWRIVFPIASWTSAEAFARMAEAGIEPNPLYRQGMRRVGCMPCIHCVKDELLEIAWRWPEAIQRVAEWERLVSECSKNGVSTFFVHPEHSVRSLGSSHAGILQDVEWAKTGRGGLQYDLERLLPPPQCSSVYGLCE